MNFLNGALPCKYFHRRSAKLRKVKEKQDTEFL